MATNTSASARPDSDGIALACRCATVVVDLADEMYVALALDAQVMTGGDRQLAREVTSVAWDRYAAANGAPSSAELSEILRLPWITLMRMAFASRAARILALWGMYAGGHLEVGHAWGCPASTAAQRSSLN